MNVVINADDLGLNPVVNKCISESLDHHYITSSTILANTEYIDDVIRIVNSHPEASFGVHLNLTQGPSLTKDKVLLTNGIIDDNGDFINPKIMHQRTSAELMDAIKLEWCEQIEHLLSKGLTLDHADGHHHCHMRAGYENILGEVLEKYGICKVRNMYGVPIKCKHALKPTVKNLLAQMATAINVDYRFNDNAISEAQRKLRYARLLRSKDISTPKYFDSYQNFYNLLFQGDINTNSDVFIELMCHPGHIRYEAEYNIIKSRAIDNYAHFNYRTYKDL